MIVVSEFKESKALASVYEVNYSNGKLVIHVAKTFNFYISYTLVTNNNDSIRF